MFPYLPKTRHDHATLGRSDIINSGIFHTLITSYIQANIYRFIYSTWLSKHYRKHTHQSHTDTYTHTDTDTYAHTHTHTHTHTHIYIYTHSPIKAIPTLKHT